MFSRHWFCSRLCGLFALNKTHPTVVGIFSCGCLIKRLDISSTCLISDIDFYCGLPTCSLLIEANLVMQLAFMRSDRRRAAVQHCWSASFVWAINPIKTHLFEETRGSGWQAAAIMLLSGTSQQQRRSLPIGDAALSPLHLTRLGVGLSSYIVVDLHLFGTSILNT